MVATRPGRHRTSTNETPELRLEAAAAWLGRAQDATGDGGISWAYRLNGGWRASYPETTGYIVPTLLQLARMYDESAYRERAARAIAFLESVRLPTGAVPAGTLEDVVKRPSVFNTGQVINGFTAWYQETHDERVRSMACKAAEWLVSVQDDDGAWRRYGYLAYPVTYTAHVSCWIAELGALIGERRFVDAAARHVDWVLSQQDPASGWIARAGFSAADHAAHRSVTHTFAYTIWGLLHAGVILDRPDAIEAAHRAARASARIVMSEEWLPGMIDADWRPRSSYACLTGNAQMALVWMRMAELQADRALDAAADRAIDLVGAAQLLHEPNPGIRGGIPGSDPVWGAYMRNTVPNWSAKFYIDALLAQMARNRSRVQAETGRASAPP
ncbi:MAG: prenyltransferase/squalene oxidase repeat-containing protein [Candidatus Limnocylindrales bacterium]